MIEVRDLVKHYGNKHAVNGISFRIEKGEIVGFLGPNGAGKSTTMNMITGYLSATSGTALIGDVDILEDPIAAKRNIGYLPEQPPLYVDMSVREYLNFVYDLKKVQLPRKAHLDEIFELVGITHVADRLIRNLSKGYRQRVGLAQALVGDPEVLILDEPTVGLDPIQIIEIRNVIKNLGRERTVILSTHILPEVQAICERVLVINNGIIVADGRAAELGARVDGVRRLNVRITGDVKSIAPVLRAIDGMKSVDILGEKESGSCDYQLTSAPGIDIRQPLFHALEKAGAAILEMRDAGASLEDIFVKLTAEAETAKSKGGRMRSKKKEEKD
ncbi:MAG: ATP-binding cassette domain-containing protein [Clostridia bacterium]|nr:ATP-binding cassette domain-containing protein [Clostridia bacterium]